MKIRQDVARRIAGRLLRAFNASVIQITPRDREMLVETVTASFVTPKARETLISMWRGHRLALREAEWSDPRPAPKLDAVIDAL